MEPKIGVPYKLVLGASMAPDSTDDFVALRCKLCSHIPCRMSVNTTHPCAPHVADEFKPKSVDDCTENTIAFSLDGKSVTVEHKRVRIMRLLRLLRLPPSHVRGAPAAGRRGVRVSRAARTLPCRGVRAHLRRYRPLPPSLCAGCCCVGERFRRG
jgi:hypothetical protein